jgi:hypothetical protein
LATGLLTAYTWQLAEASGYMGYRAFSIDLPYLISAASGLLVTGLLMPSAIRKPSDFFLLLYGLFVLMPYAVLYPSRIEVLPSDFMLYFSALAIPLVVVRIGSSSTLSVRIPGLIDQRFIVWVIVFLCAAGLAYALSNAPNSASFDLENSYDRRIEGRDIFHPGTIGAYLNMAISNGFSPFLAFFAAWRRRLFLFAFSLACGVGFYYLLGLKAPFLYVALAFLIGIAVRFSKMATVPWIIYFILSLVFMAFFIEYNQSGFSVTGDYLIRRALGVPPYIISAYFEFIELDSMSHWSLIEGICRSESIAFLVGESFLGFPGMNANTNTFIYQLAAGGLPLYMLTIVLVVFVFALLDAIYAYKKDPVFLYLGSLYAVLLTEQAATTALVSSGVGVLIVLNIMSKSARANC